MDNNIATSFLSGKKTYITMAIGVIFSITSVLMGTMDINEAVPILLASLGLGSVRHGISGEMVKIVAEIGNSLIKSEQSMGKIDKKVVHPSRFEPVDRGGID